ncbi:MAG: response regulator, partial [Planctomycetia bacterium]
VLIVEDNDDGRESLSDLLGRLGFSVATADDGPTGLQALVEKKPGAALVDVGLPGFDGYEVARSARRMGVDGATLLVALTGYGTDDDRRTALEAGFDEHLVKPIKMADLLRILNRIPRTAEPPPA